MDNIKYTKLVGVFLSAAIFTASIIWSINIYRSSLANYRQTTNQALAKAADTELRIRILSLGEKREIWYTPPVDTSMFVTRYIETEDTIIYFRVRKNDPTFLPKAQQYALKDFLPLDVMHTDSLFRLCMAEKSLPTEDSYVEYLDLPGHRVIADNRPAGDLSGYLASNTDTLDILKTIGLRVYTKTNVCAVFGLAMPQPVVSAGLTLAALLCIVLLMRTTFGQYRAWRKKEALMKAVTHEAGRPVRAATKNADRLTEQLKDKQYEGAIMSADRVKFHLDRLNVYINHIDRIVYRGKISVVCLGSVFEIRPIFGELKKKYENTGNKRVSVTVRADADLTLFSDEMHFYNVVDRLIENSVRFSGEEVDVEADASRKEDRVEIRVVDNGWGIPERDIGNIFVPGYRSEAHAVRLEERTGAGLSLSYAKDVVDALGGSISVRSKEGVFTEFRLIFPIAEINIYKH